MLVGLAGALRPKGVCWLLPAAVPGKTVIPAVPSGMKKGNQVEVPNGYSVDLAALI